MKKGIVLFGHGSRNAEWALPFEKIRNEIKVQYPGIPVELGFLELMEPSLPAVLTAFAEDGVYELVIVPVFISVGSHIREDLPRLIEEATAKEPELRITIAAPLGEAPAMLQAIARYAIDSISDVSTNS